MPPTDLRLGSLRLGPTPRVILAVARPSDPELGEARSKGVSAFEARLDLFERPDPDRVKGELDRLRGLGLPLLLTCRLRREGGRWDGDEGARKDLLLACLDQADGVDVELLSGIAPEVAQAAKAAGKLLLASHHRLDATPPDAELDERFDQGKRLGADVVKLAVQARVQEDVARLLGWTRRHRAGGVVGISLGPLGAPSRVDAGRFGSLLTYVGQDLDYGQLTLEALVAGLKERHPKFGRE